MAKNLKTSVQLDTRKAVRNLDALEKKIRNVQRAINNQAAVTNKLNTVTTKLVNTNNKVTQSSHKATVAHNKQGKAVGMLTTKLHRLANAYLGVLGAKAMITASDTITSAENKLNNLPNGNAKATQSAMNKMYTSSQSARTDYAAMMHNVSKSITLAGDAFGNNIDNAIRFQEIMAKAYSVGGASAAEQHSSMYQMIQGLGSGILQGDELRSVREGAPIAYQKIEEFAQGIFGAEENLKDLASQGKITSDIVVAAIMSAGDSIDDAFENTEMTFAQAWLNIKNTALKSFEPVLQMLNDALNSEAGQNIINGIGKAIQFVSNVLQVAFKIIGAIYNFVVDNWSVISKILLSIGAIIAIAIIPRLVSWVINLWTIAMRFAFVAGKAIASALATATAWIATNWVFLLIIAVLAAVVIAIIWVSDSFVDACGIVVGSLYWLGAIFGNIFDWMQNVVFGLWEVIKAVGTNIGIAFSNAWNTAKSAFWGFIADCLQGIKHLEPAINAIAKVFGAKGFTLSGLITDVSAKASKASQQSYVDVGAAWNKGYNTLPYQNLSDAYNEGYGIGVKGGQWIGNKLGDAKDWLADKLNLKGITEEFINPTDVDNLVNGVKGIDGNTGTMADAMELTAEDLEYLRKVAEMEWKKEFTTATIQVDMSNYNTVNGDQDLDGIVTKLTDKLYEELNSVANGVYA